MNTSPFPGLRCLLLQARSDVDMASQELDCFSERTHLQRHQIASFNVTEGNPSRELLTDKDVFFIGGAGEFSASKDYAWMPHVLDLVRYAMDADIPTFGSCWGHQIIARALGGRVEHDPSKAEMGCLPVHLTAEGRMDPLFSPFPSTFLSNMGHHDRVTVLPEGAVELARSDSQPYQAFRVNGALVYGTQFHSELDARRTRERLIRYQRFYRKEMPDDSALQRIIDNLAETTEVDHLLYDFLRLVKGDIPGAG
jgi:GMP synthase (glutamine-hydrolysing)